MLENFQKGEKTTKGQTEKQKSKTRLTATEKEAESIINKRRVARWFDQELFKSAGILMEDLEEEDRRITPAVTSESGNRSESDEESEMKDDFFKTKYEVKQKGYNSDGDDVAENSEDEAGISLSHGKDYIKEINYSDLPQMPVTEKQKRKVSFYYDSTF